MREVIEHQKEYDDFRFIIVPFVDKNGVEDGDQSKMRSPHDHGLDYIPNSIYPEVRAIMDLLRHEKPELIFDLHCPVLRNGDSQHVFFVGQADKRL